MRGPRSARAESPHSSRARNALHHLPDSWKGIALARMASLLAAGGILRLRDLAFSFQPADAEAGVAA